MKKEVIAAVLMFSMLCGCSAFNDSEDTQGSVQAEHTEIDLENKNEKPEEHDKKPAKKVKSKEEKANKENETNKNEESNKDKTVSSTAIQEAFSDTKKLNYDLLKGLDNTKYSWWITMNKKHETPGIAPNAKKLLSQYDGVYIGDTTRKVIYLTFDEGYENGYTRKILDTLKANDVRAVFFVTGPYIKGQGDLIKAMLDDGHLIGNHTINHPSLPNLDVTGVEKELYGLEKEFYSKFGKGFRYMRPPSGEYSERVLAASQQLGYKTVFWSFAYKDYETDKQKGAEYAYNMVMNNIHNGAILLLHAVSKDNADALDRIIKDIKAQGYSIELLDI